MSKLNRAQKDYIIELLAQDKDLPIDFKHILFPPERQEYELVYANKEREEDVIAETMAVPLQPIRSFGQNGDWHNTLIFGDNLQAMKTLLQMKQDGKLINADGSHGIKLIYIDPPFATKQDFQGAQQEKAYQDKIAGAQFVEFIRKRLIFLRELLTEDGCLYLHLDVKKIHYIKTIMDEIFGEGRFVNEIIWKRTSAHSDSSIYANVHDSIFFYSKSSTFNFTPQFIPYSEEHVAERYRNIETTGPRKGQRFADGDLVGTGLKGGGYPYEWKGVFRYWRCPIETMAQYDADNRLYYTKNGVARIKRYLEDAPGLAPSDMWNDIYPVNSQAAERIGYPTQKPESLLQRIIETSSSPGDIVLDSFAGSGTTVAVAEKLGRKWIAIDCGKLAIYTIQKRLLNLRKEVGERGNSLQPKPFTLYNAGLYDFSRLRSLPWPDWRFFALNLFQCQDKPHKIGGIDIDGSKSGDDVLVFNHNEGNGVVLDYGFIENLHAQIGKKTSSQFYIIAPAASVAFLEDYIDHGRTRYYILRIPYSIINELHVKDFEALLQPVDEAQVNETVEAVGFDFIQTPKVECDYILAKGRGTKFDQAVIKIKAFKSVATAKGATFKENLETLSMVLVDYDYPFDFDRPGDEPPPPFEFDDVFLAKDIPAFNV